MLVEIPDAIIEEYRVVDAAFSGRATEGMKTVPEIEKTLENAHRLLSDVSDKVNSLIVRQIRKERGV